jgi:hypothetical protein
MKWFGDQEKDILSQVPKPTFYAPPPTPKEIQQARLLLMQITDWVNNGNKEMEREIWKLLAEYANKQAERKGEKTVL